MSVDCPLLKPTCKKSLVLGNAPYKKPVCPLTDLVPKCPLTPPPSTSKCSLVPSKCPLIPDPCPLPPKCPLAPPSCPKPCPLTCPPPPPPCPLTCLPPPPPCPLTCPPPPPPCPLTCPPPSPPCPLTLPCPLPCPPPCPLTCPPCPSPCPLTCPPCSPCPPCPPPCPLTRPCPLPCPPPCPLTCPPCPCPPPCPLMCPPSCPLPCPPCSPCPPPCPLPCSPCPPCPPPCPLSCSPCPKKCPLAPEPCPLAPPKCPLSPPKCPLTPQPCPLSVPPKPQCPLLPPKCPLSPPKCPLQSPPCPDDSLTCPLDQLNVDEPCIHTQFLNKSLTRKPLSFPVPPVCHEIARKCPFEPRPMVCHELCPCSDVPEVDAGPRCPFLPPDIICPPLCPLERIPECPLIEKPSCMWKPQMPPQCPLSAPTNTSRSSPGECALQKFDICPAVLNVPGKTKKCPPAKKSLNIECCPFCGDKPKNKCNQGKSKKSFHFPTCPLYKPSCQLETLPTNTPVCPFYPCPCPLAGCGDCPIKVPPLQPLNSTTPQTTEMRSSSCTSSTKINAPSRNSNCLSECPMKSFDCNVQAADCPLASFKCPTPPPPPCPVKGCLKKPSCKKSGDCPQKTEACKLFPEGRCPKEELRLCECDYPVPPCMVDQSKPTKPPPPQYCVKDNCCMGLSDPPTIPAPKTDDTYYSYMALHPEKEATKYYIDIADEPPPDLESFGAAPTKRPSRPQCSIIKSGDGYKQCSTVKKILEKRGPCNDTGSQYDIKDCPMDEMTKRIRLSLNKKNK